MPCCKSSGECAGEWLYYDTPKMVRVKDPCLGITRYILLAAVIAYAIFEFLDKKQFLDLTIPIGVAEVFIKTPSDIVLEEALKNADYCNKDEKNVCRKWGPEKARFPQGDVNSFSLTTRFTERVVNGTAKSDESKKNFFLVGVENFEIQISHSMQNVKHFTADGEKEKHSQDDLTMNGKLIDKNGTQIRFWHGSQGVENATGKKNKPCVLQVKDLLKAAGVMENDINEYRMNGAVFHVLIKYTDTQGIRGNWPEYQITVTRVHGATSKIAQTIYRQNPNQIEKAAAVLDRYGFRFQFNFGGEVGHFSWIVFMNNFAIALVICRVVQVLLENFLAYCCFTSKDWDDLKHDEGDFHVLEQFQNQGKVDRERRHVRVVELTAAEDGKIVGKIKDAKNRPANIEMTQIENADPKSYDV